MSASWTFASGNTATLPMEKGTVILPDGHIWWENYYYYMGYSGTQNPINNNQKKPPTEYRSQLPKEDQAWRAHLECKSV